jgi:hypothetical protein
MTEVELGGFRVFMYCIVQMGVVSRAAYVLRKGGQRRHMDALLFVMLSCGFVFALLCNAKTIAINCVLGYVFTVIGVRRSLPWRVVIVGAVCAWVLTAVLAPLIFSLRTMDAKTKTMGERLSDIGDHLRRGTLSEAREQTGLYYEQTEEVLAYFGPLGSMTAIAQRIGLVHPADPIKRGIDANGFLGFSYLVHGFERIVPRVLNPEKDMENPSDVICWHAGVQDKRIVNHQAIGVISGCYAVAGWAGVLVVPFLLFTGYLLLQRLWAGTSPLNIFAVYFVAAHQNGFVEYNPSSMIGAIFRDIELEMMAFLGLIFVTRLIQAVLLTRRSSPRARPRVALQGIAQR